MKSLINYLMIAEKATVRNFSLKWWKKETKIIYKNKPTFKSI